MTAFLAGLTLGAAGGAHCLMMCGPLLAAVSPRGWRAVMHHASRSAVYLILGLTAGLAGAGAAAAGFGRWISWAAAACILLQAVLPHLMTSSRLSPALSRRAANVAGRARDLSRAHPITGAMLVGAINGLLPCGLVYAATIEAVGTGSVSSGALLMAGFAAGTTAVLAPAGAIWTNVAERVRPRAWRVAPYAYVAVALLLVWRGWAAALPTHVH